MISRVKMFMVQLIRKLKHIDNLNVEMCIKMQAN